MFTHKPPHLVQVPERVCTAIFTELCKTPVSLWRRDSRKKIINDNNFYPHCYSITLGITKSKVHPAPFVSRATHVLNRGDGRLLKLLLGVAKKYRGHEEFCFTGIHITRNYKVGWHEDDNSEQPALMLVVGTPGVGGVCFENPDDPLTPIEVNNYNHFFHANVRKAHCTAPHAFDNDGQIRFAIVYYTRCDFFTLRFDDPACLQARALGFPLWNTFQCFQDFQAKVGLEPRLSERPPFENKVPLWVARVMRLGQKMAEEGMENYTEIADQCGRKGWQLRQTYEDFPNMYTKCHQKLKVAKQFMDQLFFLEQLYANACVFEKNKHISRRHRPGAKCRKVTCSLVDAWESFLDCSSDEEDTFWTAVLFNYDHEYSSNDKENEKKSVPSQASSGSSNDQKNEQVMPAPGTPRPSTSKRWKVGCLLVPGA